VCAYLGRIVVARCTSDNVNSPKRCCAISRYKSKKQYGLGQTMVHDFLSRLPDRDSAAARVNCYNLTLGGLVLREDFCLWLRIASASSCFYTNCKAGQCGLADAQGHAQRDWRTQLVPTRCNWSD